MAMVNERIVLDFYLEQIKEDNIRFLKGKDTYKMEIENSIITLRDETSIHGRIQAAKALWKKLFEAAMVFIDRDKRGFDDLFSYFDEFVNFEELIFASDSFYRDHTLHCLWVYFLGEYLKRHDNYKNTFDTRNEEGIKAFRDIMDKFAASKHADNFKGFIEDMGKIVKLAESEDCIRCISALTHDLGYPIKKIAKINKSIKAILPYFALDNYDEFNFNYTIIQQNYINNFLKILGDEIRVDIIGGRKYEREKEFIERAISIGKSQEEPFKLNEDEVDKFTPDEMAKLSILLIPDITIITNITNHTRYSNDFEQYEHGLMSAFLLMRTISSFNTIKYAYINTEEIKPKNLDFIKLHAIQEIMRAIADHTSPKFQLEDVKEASEFLIFIDELEEFSRISRANQNRQYISEFCRTDLSIEDGWFQVDFIFDNENFDGIDPEKAFKGRCKRFLSLFRIDEMDEDLKIRLRCIGKLPYDNNVYTLEIFRRYANIKINDAEQNIPKYLKSNAFYTKEEYMGN